MPHRVFPQAGGTGIETDFNMRSRRRKRIFQKGDFRAVTVLSLDKGLAKQKQRGINVDNSSGELLLAARRANTTQWHSRAFTAEPVRECITTHPQRLARNTPRGVRNAHVRGCRPTGCWQQTPCRTRHRPGPPNPAQPSVPHCRKQIKAPRTLVLHRVRLAGAAKGFGEPRGTLPCRYHRGPFVATSANSSRRGCPTSQARASPSISQFLCGSGGSDKATAELLLLAGGAKH